MERYHLKTFITVAEEGHLTRAAQRLNTSQPAVNAHSRLDFHLLQRWTWQQFDDLAKGRIDAGFVYGESPHGDITAMLLKRCNIRIVGPAAPLSLIIALITCRPSVISLSCLNWGCFSVGFSLNQT